MVLLNELDDRVMPCPPEELLVARLSVMRLLKDRAREIPTVFALTSFASTTTSVESYSAIPCPLLVTVFSVILLPCEVTKIPILFLVTWLPVMLANMCPETLMPA